MRIVFSRWVLKKHAFEHLRDLIGMLAGEGKTRRHGGEVDHRLRLDIDRLEPEPFGELPPRLRHETEVGQALLDGLDLTDLRQLRVGRGAAEFEELNVVPVDIEAVLLEIEPVVELRMAALGGEFPPADVGKAVDS
jgi:hypothetical protein